MGPDGNSGGPSVEARTRQDSENEKENVVKTPSSAVCLLGVIVVVVVFFFFLTVFLFNKDLIW